MNRFEIDKEYPYSAIIEFAEKTIEIEMLELENEELIGESFIVLKESTQTCSFMMNSYINATGVYYKCIYNDTQDPVS